ncbi:tRNA nucleotidyltransferase [Theileria orientalis]|uniref:tRNA nucleotidyltransferase n=1 Tax=Theileria orientalis TaxID=68886 RepID=A0A976M6U7_THEOR|nr:tRNA nucleotidyltransferase [Theileria orientalis]
MNDTYTHSYESKITLDLDVYRNENEKSGQMSLTITGSEKKLFDLLTECVKFYELDMDLRVVGGWVRDKLLNNENKDIDVAIPKMTGMEFCEYLNKFTKDNYGFSKTVGIVKRCPEQSKHLETATMNVLGFDVDFVNLRSEDYASDSRIPVMRIGTPYEDCMRRDFTVNSLFYNITKNYIEDFTTRGIEDLKQGLIRTCSEPFETFMDDPLRTIRAIRFSTRLNFKLDPDLVKSINDDVLEALEQKVSRSRISQEIDNILSKSDIHEAFKQMYSFRMLHVLLNVPVRGDRRVDKVSGVTEAMLSEACSLMSKFKKCTFEDVEHKYLYLAALVVPTRELSPVGKMTVADYLIKERLKLPNKYSSSANSISNGSLAFTDYLNGSIRDRVSTGLAIRTVGPLWKESLVMSLTETNRVDYKEFDEVVSLAKKHGITEAYNFKAPVTGSELMELLPKITSGPKFKAALEFQVKVMLQDENVSKDELKDRLKAEFRELL